MFIQTITDKYNELQKVMEDQWIKERTGLDEDLTAIDETIIKIDEIVGDIDPDANTFQDIDEKLRGVTEISTHVKNTIAGSRSYKHFEFQDNGDIAADL